jgi:hypothetical protein
MSLEAISNVADIFYSNSHRHYCDVKAKDLRLQERCAVCPKWTKKKPESNVACDTCSGIIYCSSKCKEDNA